MPHATQSPDRTLPGRGRLWAPVTALTITGILVLVVSVQRFEVSAGIDFYHMWGIGMIPDIADSRLNPYTDSTATANLLNSYADTSEDARLRRANATRRSIDPTGTPLFYTTFAFLPDNYTAAQIIFTILQYVAFASGVLLFLQYCRVGWFMSIAVLFVSIATFRPFIVDVRVGNVNAFQLLGIVLLMMAARRIRGRNTPAYLWVMAACVFTIWKPNVLPITLLLLVVYGMRLSRPTAARSAIGGLVALLFAIIVSTAWFRDPGIWWAWYGYVSGSGSSKLGAYAVADGNLSTGTVLAQMTGTSRWIWTIGIAGFLGFSFLVSLHAAARRNGQSLLAEVRGITSNTGLVATLSICLTAAAAPLMWRHYFTWVALAPAWLVLNRRVFDREIALPAIALLLYWEPPGMTALLGPSLMDTLQALAWLPVWVVLIERIRNAQRSGGEQGLPIQASL